jgi:hypothetical protein
MNISQFFILMISCGVGSNEWLSDPGGSSIVIVTLSPAICLTKSYCGNIVVTTSILPLDSVIVFCPQPAGIAAKTNIKSIAEINRFIKE